MEVETSLLEVRKLCQVMELLSYLGLNSVCKHPDFNSVHTKGMTCYFKGHLMLCGTVVSISTSMSFHKDHFFQ